MSIVVFTLIASMAGPAPDQARVFEKTRADGVTVVCVRHDRKPTILTSRVECKPAARWRAAHQEGPQTNSPGGTYTTEFAFTSPKPTPRLMGK